MLELNPSAVSSSNENDDDPRGGTGTSVLTRPEQEVQRPPMYKVLLLNDDYTPMEFVVTVLERFFNMTHQHAVLLMLTVHQVGVGVAGVFTHEVAETKAKQVRDFAKKNEHPLMCIIEKE